MMGSGEWGLGGKKESFLQKTVSTANAISLCELKYITGTNIHTRHRIRV